MPLASSQDQDARFAVFLNPIRDLTKNWEVDIAKYLEQYLEELSEIQITFDGGETMMNFAEAAMLIQGSANIYSKKIEYLWQMVLKMLDLLSNKKKLGNQEEGEGEASGPSGGKSKNSHADLTVHFQKVDNISSSRNIDLKEEEQNNDDKVKAFNLMPATPLHLVEKEAEKCKNKINLYLANMDTFGGKDDFRLNRLHMTSYGLLCLEMPRESLNNYTYVPSDPIQNVDDKQEAPLPPSPTRFPPPMDNEPLQDMEDNLDHSLGLEPMPELEMPCEVEDERERVEEEPQVDPNLPIEVGMNRLRRRNEPSPIKTTDPWLPLDPHEQSSPPRPVRLGRIRKPPPCSCHKSTPQRTRKRKKLGNGLADKISPIDEHILKKIPDVVNNNTKTSLLPVSMGDIHPALRDENMKEFNARDEISKRKETLAVLAEGLCETIDEARELQEEREQQRNIGIAAEYVDEGVADDVFDNDEPFDMPDPHAGLPDDRGGGSRPLDRTIDMNDTMQYEPDGEYEALVQKWVADYVVNAQDHIISSDLTRRVNRWRSKVTPILAKEEDRLEFDIHSYGSKILDKFDESKEIVAFSDVVSGLPQNEVARVFLSSLMLSNTYNVKPILTKPGDLVMDCLSLKLLTRVRHHEEMQDYMAPSQNTASTSTAPTKKKTNPRKPRNEPNLESSDSEDSGRELDNEDVNGIIRGLTPRVDSRSPLGKSKHFKQNR